MQKIGAGVATGLFVVAISFSAPSAAVALGLGPFHIGLPLSGRTLAHRHRTTLRGDVPTEARICADAGSPDASSPSSALLYPSLALPAIYSNVFRPPSSSPWPFGYDAIFRAAFGKTVGDENKCSCQADRGSAVIDRFGKEIRPGAAQRPLLQKLGGALATTSKFLAKFCPEEIPVRPVARLKVMETQLEVLTMALDIIREPLRDFEQSLNRNQRARLAAILSAQHAGHKNAAEDTTWACGTTPTAVNWSIDELDQTLKPDETQQAVMATIKQAFGSAASDLDTQCPISLKATPLARLDALQARLDAEWRAVLTIQAALADVEGGLSDDQRDRFNSLDFSAR